MTPGRGFFFPPRRFGVEWICLARSTSTKGHLCRTGEIQTRVDAVRHTALRSRRFMGSTLLTPTHKPEPQRGHGHPSNQLETIP